MNQQQSNNRILPQPQVSKRFQFALISQPNSSISPYQQQQQQQSSEQRRLETLNNNNNIENDYVFENKK